MFKTAVISLDQKRFYGEFIYPLFSGFKHSHNGLKVSLLVVHFLMTSRKRQNYLDSSLTVQFKISLAAEGLENHRREKN